MYDFLSVGDTSHNVFLEMSDDTVQLLCKKDDAACQICFTYADKIPVHAFHDTIGGNSANAAVAFARLGFKTAFYTHVGNDDQAVRIQKALEQDHVNTDYVVQDGDKMSNFSTVINLHGERTILVYHEHRHYVMPKAEPARWMYLSSMGEGSDQIFPDICAYVDEHHVNLCYQPGTFQLKMGAAGASDLLRHTKIFMVNKEEAELYLGIEPTDDFRLLLDKTRALGPEIALITDGPKGAYVSDGKEYLYLGIIEEAPRNEATGAGDAFSSTFACALASGCSLGEALRWGQSQSSSVIQKVGPQAGLVTRDELNKILEANPDLQPTAIPDK
jgi:ribokinase